MRILFLTHRLPYAPNRGDRVRAYHIIKHLAASADVHLLSLVHDDEEAAHVEDMKTMTASVTVARAPRLANAMRSLVKLPTSTPTTHTMLNAPDFHSKAAALVASHQPDLVFAYCTGIAHAALRDPLARLPLVIDFVDVDSEKWAALASSGSPPRSWIYAREARVLARFEREVTRRAFATLITTEREAADLRRLSPGARVEVVQNGVDLAALQPKQEPQSSSTIVFCGVMDYPPNEEGAVWLAREVWPLVRARRPDATLQIVGSSPTKTVRELASAPEHIEVTGAVPDVREYLWRAAAAAAPLLTARGVQNKVLEAVAAGLPTVVTPVVHTGVPPEMHAACIVADGAAAFASGLISILEESPTERRAHAARAQIDALSWECRLAGVNQVLTDATG